MRRKIPSGPNLDIDQVMWTDMGRKYHIGKCRGFYAFNNLSFGSLSVGTPQLAASEGKLPCLMCKPPIAFDPPYTRTHGHHPVSMILDGRSVGLACTKCEVRDTPVRWPCTTATVLGLL